MKKNTKLVKTLAAIGILALLCLVSAVPVFAGETTDVPQIINPDLDLNNLVVYAVNGVIIAAVAAGVIVGLIKAIRGAAEEKEQDKENGLKTVLWTVLLGAVALAVVNIIF